MGQLESVEELEFGIEPDGTVLCNWFDDDGGFGCTPGGVHEDRVTSARDVAATAADQTRASIGRLAHR